MQHGAVSNMYCNVPIVNGYEAAPSNQASTPYLTSLLNSISAKKKD